MGTVAVRGGPLLFLTFGWIVAAIGQTLAPNQAAEGTLEPGAERVYLFSARAGEYVAVSATPQSADLALLLASGDQPLVKIDRLRGEGSEQIFWIAPSAADLRLTVSAKKTPVSYRVMAEVRQPTARDLACAAAYGKTWIEVEAKLAGSRGPEIPANLVRPLLALEESALPEWEACGNPSWSAYARYKLSTGDYRLGNMQKARDLLRETVALLRPLNEPRELAGALNNAGFYHSRLDEERDAIAVYEEAASLRRKHRDRLGLGNTLNNLGLSHLSLSELVKAEDYLQQSAAVRLETNDKSGRATTLSNLSMLYRQRNDYQAALEASTESLRIRTELGDKRGQAVSLTGLAVSYSEFGDLRRARDYNQRALELYQEVRDRSGIATSLNNLGTTKLRQGHASEALPDLEGALAVRREMQAVSGQIGALHAMCRALLALNRLDQARQRCSEAVKLGRSIEDQPALGTALLVSSRVKQQSGDLEGAAEMVRESLTSFLRARNRDQQSMALAALAGIERDRGRLPEALLAVEEATRLADLSRRNVPNADLRASYRSQRSDRINLHTDILMRLHARDTTAGYELRAFALAEQWRARSLVELIRGTAHKDLAPDQQRRQEELWTNISRTQQELLRGRASQRLASCNCGGLCGWRKLNSPSSMPACPVAPLPHSPRPSIPRSLAACWRRGKPCCSTRFPKNAPMRGC